MEIISKRKLQRIQIDDADLPMLDGYSLGVHWNTRGHCYYGTAARLIDGKWVVLNLGRLLLGLPKGDKRECEHINPNDTLDYRRSNLRIANRSQNNRNRRMRKDNTSGYKGVVAYGKGFRAQIMVNKRAYVLGTRPTKEEAYRLYCAAAKRLHREFARPEKREA
jgi:hypothetical protein